MKKRNIDWSADGRKVNMQKRNLRMKSGQQPKPFLFTKIARTASESMAAVFRERCLNYIRFGRLSQCLDWYSTYSYEEPNFISICHNHFPVPYLRACKIIPDEWYHGLFKFTFVRNPWDRLVSYWRLYNSSGPTSAVGMLAKGCDDFTQFVYKCVDKRLVTEFDPTGKDYALINPQWRWILPDFDFVGCYEYLERDWKELNQRIETTFVLNRHVQLHSDRGRTRRHYTDYYDSTTAKLVETLYRTDIDIFGYESIECQTPHDSSTILDNLRVFWNSLPKEVKRRKQVSFSKELTSMKSRTSNLFKQIREAVRDVDSISPEMMAAVDSLGKDKKRPLGKFNPWAWCVEVTRGCNLSCAFCPTRLYPKGEQLYVSDETWGAAVEIVNELMPYTRFLIANWGEPTLHPRFLELMRMARKTAPNMTLLLYTNGTQILNGNLAYSDLFASGLNAVYVDVYGSREKHIELAKASGCPWWEEGKRPKHTKNLFERKQGEGQGNFIQISRNPTEWLPSKSNRGALMTFCNDLDWEAARKIGMTPVVHPPHRRCDQPVKFPTFVWNGYYVFCGQDVMNHTTGEFSDGKLGNVKDGPSGFLKFWLGQYMQDTRAKVHDCKDGRASHERCRQCCFVGGRADVPIWKAGFSEYWDGNQFVALPPWKKVEAPNGELKKIAGNKKIARFGLV